VSTDDKEIHRPCVSLARRAGAAGAALQCDEDADFRTFRIGLFGLDKLGNIDRTVHSLEQALAGIEAPALAAR
jgi:aspartate aminotransferase-like enzyme